MSAARGGGSTWRVVNRAAWCDVPLPLVSAGVRSEMRTASLHGVVVGEDVARVLLVTKDERGGLLAEVLGGGWYVSWRSRGGRLAAGGRPSGLALLSFQEVRRLSGASRTE